MDPCGEIVSNDNGPNQQDCNNVSTILLIFEKQSCKGN